MYSSFLKARGLNQSAFVIQEAGIQDWGQWIPGARSRRRRVQKAIERGQNPKKGASDKRGVSITYRVSLRWRPPLHQLLSSPSSHRASHSSKQRAIRRNKSDRSFDDEKITGGGKRLDVRLDITIISEHHHPRTIYIHCAITIFQRSIIRNEAEQRRIMFAPSDQQITDPIQVIGPSLLLQVFYSLPLRDLLNCSLVSTTWYTLIDNHSTSIFRDLASDIVSDKRRLQFLKSLGQDEVRDPTLYNASFIRAGTLGSDKKISWRGICRDAVVTERNWKYGRAKPGWLTPGRNTVWRMKVDPEENVLYTVSRLGEHMVNLSKEEKAY